MDFPHRFSIGMGTIPLSHGNSNIMQKICNTLNHQLQGVIDSNGLKEMNTAAAITSKMAEKGDYLKANAYSQKTMGLLYKLSYGVDVYNVLKSEKLGDETRLATIMNGDVKAALNLSTTWTNFNSKVYHFLGRDFMKPVAHLGSNNKF